MSHDYDEHADADPIDLRFFVPLTLVALGVLSAGIVITADAAIRFVMEVIL